MPKKKKKQATTWWKWLLLIVGLLLIVAGIYLMFTPMEAVAASVMLIGIILIFNGIFSIVAYFANRGMFGISGWILAEGIISALVGVLVLSWPGISATALLFFVGVWILIAGIIRIVNAINMANYGVPDWGWTLFFGIIMTILGIFSFVAPVINVFAIALVLGFYFITLGVVNIIEFSMIDRIDHAKLKLLRAFKK